MRITYDVSCFERELIVIFSDELEDKGLEIWDILNDAYNEWHSPEEIEDPEGRAYVEDSCCEEYMMVRLSSKFNQWERWTSEYYGNDPDEMEEEIFWTENK